MAKKRKKKNKKNKSKLGFRAFISVLSIVAGMIFYLPITFVLIIGMLPTLAAASIDTGKGKNKTLTVGSMNLAGCMPYLLDLCTGAGEMEDAIFLLSSPTTIIIIYGAAVVGYLINWLATMAVAAVIIQQSKSRIKKIEETKKNLEKRWGKKVNGTYNLDSFGFILDVDDLDSKE